MPRPLLLAAQVLVPLLVVLVFVRVVDLGASLRLLAGVEPPRFAAVLALFGMGQVLSCVRWRLALSQMVPSPPPVAALLRLYLIGMFVDLGLPSMAGGDVVRAELTQRRIGTRGDAYASILADRLIGLLAVILLAVVATLLTSTLFGGELRRFVAAAALASALALALLFPLLTRLSARARGGPFGRFLDALLVLARRPGSWRRASPSPWPCRPWPWSRRSRCSPGRWRSTSRSRCISCWCP